MPCQHCKSPIGSNEKCGTCGRKLKNQCPECHDELEHGLIVNQNIHIVGSGAGDTIDHDSDAYGRAD